MSGSTTPMPGPPTDLAALTEGLGGEHFTPSPRCPVCGGGSRVAHGARNINPALPVTFDYRTCDACLHAWIDPLPSQALLDHLYGRASHTVIGVGWADSKKTRLTPPERFVLRAERGHAPGVYFELGVGQGTLLEAFAGLGWTCGGVEPGRWGPSTNLHRSLDEVPAGATADVLCALDVLEHLANPLVALGRMRQMASPGTRLYVAFPNGTSRRARVEREAWRMLRPLGHLHYWSRRSLEQTLQQAGFRPVLVRTSDLWEARQILRPRTWPSGLVQLLGQGDQWLVAAAPI